MRTRRPARHAPLRRGLLLFMLALVACKSDNRFTLELQTGREPATVQYGAQAFTVPAKSRYAMRGTVGTPIEITANGETITWTIPARPGESYVVPVSKRQCFATQEGELQTEAAPLRVQAPARQVRCGTRLTPKELAILPGSVMYDDIIALDAGKTVPDDSGPHRSHAAELAKATGFAVATSSPTRALLYQGSLAVAVGMPLGGAAFTPTELDRWKTELAKPSRSPTLATTERLSVVLTYASIAAEFPGLYSGATQREITVKAAEPYGNIQVLYSLGEGPYLSRAEVKALAAVGIDLDALVAAQVAAAAPALDACVRALSGGDVECANDKTEREAALRLLALLERPSISLVARIVNAPDFSGATLVLSPRDASPARNPDGTLPYSLVLDGGTVTAR